MSADDIANSYVCSILRISNGVALNGERAVHASQEVCEKLRDAAAEGGVQSARVQRLEAQLLEALRQPRAQDAAHVDVSHDETPCQQG